MNVILLKDVTSLGKEGEVVDVSDGHARNFLFPQNMAVPATDAALQQAKERNEKTQRNTQRDLDKDAHAANMLDGTSIVLEKNVNDSDTLYGAVSEAEVLRAVREKTGLALTKASVVFPEPIKTVGEHTVTIVFPNDFEAQISVSVEEA